MKALYKPVPLDPRAREYVAAIPSARTRETALNALKAFCAFRLHGSPAPLAWRTMDYDTLSRFSQWLRGRGFSDLSRKTYLSCVTEFLRYALENDWLSSTFSLDRALHRKRKATERMDYPMPQPSARIPEIISYYDRLAPPTPDDEKARRRVLIILRARAVMHTLYSSAARVSEIAQLTRKQVQDGKLAKIVVSGKGKKDRFIYLTPEAQRAIAVYCSERQDAFESLFVSHGKQAGQPLSRVMLWKIVMDAARALGLKAHPHEIRHYRATEMLNKGMRMEYVQAILGHKSIETTQLVYAKLSDANVQAEFDRVSHA